MKYIKNFMLITCLSLSMTACDDSDDVRNNETNAVLEFESSSITVKEDADFITVPIVVSGTNERNGDIFFQVSLKSENGNLKLDRDIILTTDHYRIPAGTNKVTLEIGLRIENAKIEHDRYITLAITDPVGATVGAKGEYRIDITEKNPMDGSYLIRGINPFNGYLASGRVEVTFPDEAMENATFDFGLGNAIPVAMTMMIPDRLYFIEIEAFQSAGLYNGSEIYLSWASLNAKGKLIYEKDGVKPNIKGILEILSTEAGKKYVFTFNEGFGLVSLVKDEVAWYQSDVFSSELTATKEE
ncbi:hypothetical protein [Bacteroides sp.]|uniref:hypothetical protein n=1 Tax=Bacteroides sp. TaxID=29523 RepID=UPI0025C43498|nr:hypothetical protein [Bacteroides sp.]